MRSHHHIHRSIASWTLQAIENWIRNCLLDGDDNDFRPELQVNKTRRTTSTADTEEEVEAEDIGRRQWLRCEMLDLVGESAELVKRASNWTQLNSNEAPMDILREFIYIYLLKIFS